MARRDGEYFARIQDDSGTVRGKIPSPLVRDMGAKPGHFMVFRMDDSGTVTVSVTRSKGTKKSRAAAKRSSHSTEAKRGRGRPRKNARQ